MPVDLESAPHIRLKDIHVTLQNIQTSIKGLSSAVRKLEAQIGEGANDSDSRNRSPIHSNTNDEVNLLPVASSDTRTLQNANADAHVDAMDGPAPFVNPDPGLHNSKVILTTYPGQSGINPIPLHWGHLDPLFRGPVVVSRAKGTVRRRNAIGAHGGSYSIYHALAIASNDLTLGHRPDFTNTEPAVRIGPFPQWGEPQRIVSMDPFGHLAPRLYSDLMNRENLDIRPTIAITKAHMNLPEIGQSVRDGRLTVDGKVCLNEKGDLAVTKFAVEPVWYLPGVAKRFGIGTWFPSLFLSSSYFKASGFYLRNAFLSQDGPCQVMPRFPLIFSLHSTRNGIQCIYSYHKRHS